MSAQSVTYLIVAGWQGSPPEHWQSHWQNTLPNAHRVIQEDWLAPQPHAWMAALERTIEETQGDVIVIAHSLGCITLANWAQQTTSSARRKVRGALLVAPADVERAGCPEALRGFAPISSTPLPFPSQVIGSSNDPAASPARVLHMARTWGSDIAILPGAGHINVKSGHQRWEQGFGYLYRLQQQIEDNARQRA